MTDLEFSQHVCCAVIATGDTAIYLPPEGDSEVEGEDWIVVYDYPKHSEVEAGLQEQASSKVVACCAHVCVRRKRERHRPRTGVVFVCFAHILREQVKAKHKDEEREGA